MHITLYYAITRFVMSIASRATLNLLLKNNFRTLLNERKCMATVASELLGDTKKEETYETPNSAEQFPPPHYRFVYPEFLPDPYLLRRNKMRERLERRDMLARRSNVEVPEFYVGSIVAVTHSDRHAPGKTSRFLGICIKREGCGLRASFMLRNVIDNLGTDIIFDLYDPTIQKIEVIRLEKRLDEELLYLRDCPPEYSTFPLDMEPEYHPEGAPVPVNDIKIALKPTPWLQRWERKQMKGLIDPLSMVNEKRRKKAALPIHNRPWEEYDLMKMYRETIPMEEQQEIFGEIHPKLQELEIKNRKMKRSRTFVKPKKTG